MNRSEPINSLGFATQEKSTRQYATFFVGDLFLGMEVLSIQEVLGPLAITPVPLAPPLIQGLINLRGQVVPALDMRRRLGLSRREANNDAMNVVIRSSDGPISLLVDDVGDVLEIDEGLLEQIPENFDQSLQYLITAIYASNNRVLFVLDPEKTADIFAGRSDAKKQQVQEL